MKAAANRAIVGSQIRQAAAAGMRGSTPFGSPFPHFTFSRRYSAAHLRPPPSLTSRIPFACSRERLLPAEHSA
jgi:hypothetical protein